MAKKRLNKKVALIGSVIFAFLMLGAILLFLYLSRDPEKFIKDGDAALKTAREAVDEQVKQEEYARAIRNYNKANALAKTDSVKVEMLFKLADIYMETDNWRNVHGCWNRIIQIDPENIKARLGRLRYFYMVADSTGGRVVWQWQEVESQASEFIEVVEDTDLLMEDTAKWESFGMREKGAGVEYLGPFLYMCRGRALLEMARLGGVTDPEALLLRAIDDFEKARELEPANIEIYNYLARAIIAKGNILASRGDFEVRDESRKQATELLEKAVEISGDNVMAHINYLLMKSTIVQEDDSKQLQSLEPEYLSLVKKFGSSPEAFSALSGFYINLGYKYLDKALETAKKSLELDPENVIYAINVANLYYRKFSVYGEKQAIYKGVGIAENALNLPGALDTPGPWQVANRMNRISLYLFLVQCYIEQVLEPSEIRTEQETGEWLAKAEQTVHEIEQLLGTGEDPYVVEWQGMLDLARGNENEAVKELYAAYEQIKASGIEDPETPPSLFKRSYAQLSYVLAKIFEGTPELGAVGEFSTSAIRTGIGRVKPEVILHYGDVLLRLKSYNAALGVVDFFENVYWANEESRTLRINIYIAAQQFNDAEKELAKMRSDDPNLVKLNLAMVQTKIEQVQGLLKAREMQRSLDVILSGSTKTEKEIAAQTAELKSYSVLRGQLVEKLLLMKPDFIGEDSVVAVCDDYIKDGKVTQARDLVNRFLRHFPANTQALLYKQILSEPEPGKISQEKREEMEEQILLSVSDPTERSMKVGVFYQEHNQPDKAVREFKKVFKMETLQESAVGRPVSERTGEITDSQRLAADHLLDIALEQQDWELAEQIVDAVRRGNLDGCEGQFFAARLDMAKGEYESALTRLDQSLKQRPVFSRAFLLKSKANTALGNEHEAIENARQASSLNPFDGPIAEQLAFVLYERNRKLGENTTSDQILEVRNALQRAVALNVDNPDILSFYAEYIIAVDPFSALAIRMELQRTNPSLRNAVLLGRMATRLASRERSAQRKEVLFNMADSAFEQAREIDPNDKLMLVSYAEYLNASGKTEEADQLLKTSEDQRLVWTHYLQMGQFEDAKKVLEQLYQTGPKEVSTLRGLLLIAEKQADEEAVKKYSEELLSIEDTVENRLVQIQMFLNVGLIKEAEYKLQSFKEKFPGENRELMLEALLEMKKGRLEKALELTNLGLETSQENAVAWRLRGQINFLMANYDQAVIDLERSKLLSNEPITRVALARAYQRAGRYEDAITELKAIIANPQAPVQAITLLEQIYWKLGRRKELSELYNELLKKFPGSVYWRNRAGEFAVRIGDVGKAEELYRQAWQKSKEYGSGDRAALEGYLGSLMAGGKLDTLFEEAGKYVDSDFADVALVKMAEAKLKLGDKAAAKRYLQQALDKAGPHEAMAYNILRIMYVLLGMDEAQACCEQMLQTAPDSLVANMAMFNFKKISGEYNSALNYIDKCLQIIGPDSPARVDYIRRKVEVLTLVYTETSDNEYLLRAIVEYESLLDKMPNNSSVLNNLAYLLAEENTRLDEALKYAKQACDAQPNNPNYLDTYSYVLYKNGRFSEAAEYLQAALQLFEQKNISASVVVYEHLGMIREKLGSVDEAIAAYEQALEVGQDGLQEVVKERIESAIENLRSQSEK